MNEAGWQPSASLDTLRLRAGMLARVRGYFASESVVEVETPLLSRAAVTDVHLESVPAKVAGFGSMFLHTSPEYAMKRLLAAGLGDCYQVCRVFRDGERGSLHNPEFTMIEWYRLGLDASGLMDDVEALVAHVIGDLRPLPRAERLTYRDAVRGLCGIDAMTSSAGEISGALLAHGIDTPPTLLEDRDALLDLLVSTVAGPCLGRTRPTFVYDYPASQAALARIRPGDIPVAERFELYLDGIELANGFHELGDATEQRRRFDADLSLRLAAGKPSRPVDERLLAALAHGLPDCAGVALGFDRLVMAALGLDSIDQAMAFTCDRA